MRLVSDAWKEQGSTGPGTRCARPQYGPRRVDRVAWLGKVRRRECGRNDDHKTSARRRRLASFPLVLVGSELGEMNQAQSSAQSPPRVYPPLYLPEHLRIAFIHPDLGIGQFSSPRSAASPTNRTLSFQSGGAERLVVDAAVALQNRGHNVELFTSFHEDDEGGRNFEETRNGQCSTETICMGLCGIAKLRREGRTGRLCCSPLRLPRSRACGASLGSFKRVPVVETQSLHASLDGMRRAGTSSQSLRHCDAPRRHPMDSMNEEINPVSLSIACWEMCVLCSDLSQSWGH
jgi:hypothetical protein